MTQHRRRGSDPELGQLAGALSLVAQLGLTMIGSIAAGFAIGLLLEKKVGGGGWFLGIFLPLGIIAGFVNCLRLLKKLGIWKSDGSE